jgi:hypothetical protein
MSEHNFIAWNAASQGPEVGEVGYGVIYCRNR